MRAARAAMSPALLSASDALLSRPERPFAAPPSHCHLPHAAVVPERQAVPDRERICGGEQRSVRGRRAQRASKNLTRRVCPSVMSVANAASYTARPRTEQRSGVDAQHRPPQLSGLTGTACRDLVVIQRVGRAAQRSRCAASTATVERTDGHRLPRPRGRRALELRSASIHSIDRRSQANWRAPFVATCPDVERSCCAVSTAARLLTAKLPPWTTFSSTSRRRRRASPC